MLLFLIDEILHKGNDLLSSNAKRDELREKNNQYIDENKLLKQENSELRKKNTQNELLQQEKSQFRENTSKLNTQNMQGHNKLKQEMIQLGQRYSKLEQENSQLNQENSQLNQENSQLNQKNSQLNQENSELNQKNSQLQLREGIWLRKNVKGNIDNIREDRSFIDQFTDIIVFQENMIHCLEKDRRTLFAIRHRMQPFLIEAAEHHSAGPGSGFWPNLPTERLWELILQVQKMIE